MTFRSNNLIGIQFVVENKHSTDIIKKIFCLFNSSVTGQYSAQPQASKHPWQLCPQPIPGLEQPCLLLQRRRRGRDRSHVVMGVADKEEGVPGNDVSQKQPRFPPEGESYVAAWEPSSPCHLFSGLVCMFVCLFRVHVCTYTPRHTCISQEPSKINQTGTWWKDE